MFFLIKRCLIIGVKTRVMCGLKTETYVLRNVFLHLRRFHLCVTIPDTARSHKHTYMGQLTTQEAVWYSLLLLCTKPVQHVTVLNSVGSCNTMVGICMSQCRKGTIKMWYKR